MASVPVAMPVSKQKEQAAAAVAETKSQSNNDMPPLQYIARAEVGAPGSSTFEVDRAALAYNSLLLFQRWDSSDVGKLTFKEIALGFAQVKWLTPISSLERHLSTISHRVNFKEHVTVREFPRFFLKCCGDDVVLAWQRLDELKSVGDQDPDAVLATDDGDVLVTLNEDGTEKVDLNSGLVMASSSRKRPVRRAQAQKPTWYSKLTTGMAPIFFAVFVWITVGIIFYTLHNDWSVPQGFYYCIQSGLSIGFGALSEPNDGSKAFTVINVLLGSTAIGGALAFFAQNMLESQSNWYEEVEQQVKTQRLNDKGINIKRAFSSWYETHRTKIITLGAVAIWLVVGIVFGIIHSEWSFITSLYFSVAAMSTGGLQAPDTDDSSMLFTGIYALVGVPIYAVVLGQFAGAVIERYERNKLQERLSQKITDKEFGFATKLGSSDGKVDVAEFVEMELLRLGRVDLGLLREIHSRFDYLDIMCVGYITKEVMHASMVFERLDVDASGALSLEELERVVHEVTDVFAFETPPTRLYLQDRFFEGTTEVDRATFMKWLVQTQTRKV